MTDIWTMLENPVEPLAAVADLYHWSTNFNAGEGPFTLFLDLTGWSEEHVGEPLYSLDSANLGYMELAKLGAALTQYADSPATVSEFVDSLMTAELDL